MAKKERYLEAYSKGLEYGKDGIKGRINKALDWVGFGGTQTEGEREGLEQGYNEMKAAQKAEANRSKIINKPSSEVQKFDENYKRGGKVSSASKRADGCCIKGKTKGKMV